MTQARYSAENLPACIIYESLHQNFSLPEVPSLFEHLSFEQLKQLGVGATIWVEGRVDVGETIYDGRSVQRYTRVSIVALAETAEKWYYTYAGPLLRMEGELTKQGQWSGDTYRCADTEKLVEIANRIPLATGH